MAFDCCLPTSKQLILDIAKDFQSGGSFNTFHLSPEPDVSLLVKETFRCFTSVELNLFKGANMLKL